MNAQAQISLLTQDPETEESVSNLFNSQNGIVPGQVFRDIHALTAGLERNPVSVALVDIDSDPARIIEGLEGIVRRFTDTRFVILTGRLDSDLVLKAMHAGVRHVQLKSSLNAELAAVLGRLIQHGGDYSRNGRIFTVLSASGGCGATTLAVNLANEMRLGSDAPTLVVDMDYTYGAVASYLNLSGKYGVADVMGRDGSLDAHLLASTAINYADNLHVLLSPASIDFAADATVRTDKIGPFLDACRGAYHSTLIDAPRVSIETASVLAQGSEAVLIVQQLTVKDIRFTRELMWALGRTGVQEDRIRVLVNRHSKRHQAITLQEAENVLKDVKLHPLCNDYRNTIHSINYGKPLAETAPRSSLRKELARLAAEIIEFESNTNGSKGH